MELSPRVLMEVGSGVLVRPTPTPMPHTAPRTSQFALVAIARKSRTVEVAVVVGATEPAKYLAIMTHAPRLGAEYMVLEDLGYPNKWTCFYDHTPQHVVTFRTMVR